MGAKGHRPELGTICRKHYLQSTARTEVPEYLQLGKQMVQEVYRESLSSMTGLKNPIFITKVKKKNQTLSATHSKCYRLYTRKKKKAKAF